MPLALSKIRQLREERGSLHAQATEILKKKALTAEERSRVDKLLTDMERLGEDIQREERAAELAAELGATRRPPEAQITDRGPESEGDEAYRSAFKNFLRHGLMPNSHGERGVSAEEREVLMRREVRDMGVTTGALGGFFVPQGFVYDVEKALKYFGNMLGEAEILNTATGQPLPYPTDNDTTNTGELTGEGQQVSTQDVGIGHITFGAYKFDTRMVKVSLELLQDSAFDIEAFLKQKFAIRLGRSLNTYFTVGTGSNQPTGIITAAVANNGTPQAASAGVAVGIPLVAAGSGGNTGNSDSAQTTIGSQDLINLEHTVDRLYRRGPNPAKFMMHDGTLRYVKQLLDRYGRPLWLPGVAVNEPDTINGYEYSINNDMATLAHSAVTVAFGPLKKYLIRRVRELSVLRLTERYADYGQVAFIGFARYDGNLLDAGTQSDQLHSAGLVHVWTGQPAALMTEQHQIEFLGLILLGLVARLKLLGQASSRAAIAVALPGWSVRPVENTEWIPSTEPDPIGKLQDAIERGGLPFAVLFLDNAPGPPHVLTDCDFCPWAQNLEGIERYLTAVAQHFAAGAAPEREIPLQDGRHSAGGG